MSNDIIRMVETANVVLAPFASVAVCGAWASERLGKRRNEALLSCLVAALGPQFEATHVNQAPHVLEVASTANGKPVFIGRATVHHGEFGTARSLKKAKLAVVDGRYPAIVSPGKSVQLAPLLSVPTCNDFISVDLSWSPYCPGRRSVLVTTVLQVVPFRPAPCVPLLPQGTNTNTNTNNRESRRRST